MTSTFSAWWLVLLAWPVLAVGRYLCRRVAVFARFNLPVPVVGGLAVSLVLLVLNVAGVWRVSFENTVTAGAWTWLVTPDHEWLARPAKSVNLPLLVAFFTCIGLNATWRVVKAGSWQLLLFWGLATLLAVLQNVLGMSLAALLGASPLLGLICGSVSMTGGHGTALGFAPTLVHAGFGAAAPVGAAAATFGLVAGGLIGSPLATRLIRQFKLAPGAATERPADEGTPAVSPVPLGWLRRERIGAALGHLLVLAACIKAGAWLSYFLQRQGLVFPAYMGALLVGVAVRNLWDVLRPGQIDSGMVDALGGVFLAVFLAIAMMSLNLAELTTVAGPMMVVLFIQIPLMLAFARWVTFRLLGRDYAAAIMAGGHCGFGMGATPTAIANMDALTSRYGSAPRAYVVVPPTGAFLIDFTNALVITAALNFLR